MKKVELLFVSNLTEEGVAHVLRFLKDSVDNGPGIIRNQAMQAFLRELIREREQLPSATTFG